MAGIRSNFESVASAVRGTARALDFDARLPGGRRLGALMAEAIAVGIFKRSLGRQVDPQGQPFAALSPAYLKWKVANGYSPRRNVKTGKMLSLEQIRGTTRITKDRVDLTYGRDSEAQRLAELAEKGGKGRPPRPFYGLDPEIEAKLDALAGAAIDDVIRELGGS